MLARSFLIKSSSMLLVTRTGIIAQTSLILGQIRLCTHFGVTCPWMTKISQFRTLIPLRPVGQSWSNCMCSITGEGERLHKVLRQIGSKLDQILCVASLWWGKGCIRFWGRLDQNSGFHGNRKPPLTFNGENGVSTFSWLLLIWSFFILASNEDIHKISDEFEFRSDRTTDYRVAALERLNNFP